jgi:hypothetical protein
MSMLLSLPLPLLFAVHRKLDESAILRLSACSSSLRSLALDSASRIRSFMRSITILCSPTTISYGYDAAGTFGRGFSRTSMSQLEHGLYTISRLRRISCLILYRLSDQEILQVIDAFFRSAKTQSRRALSLQFDDCALHTIAPSEWSRVLALFSTNTLFAKVRGRHGDKWLMKTMLDSDVRYVNITYEHVEGETPAMCEYSISQVLNSCFCSPRLSGDVTWVMRGAIFKASAKELTDFVTKWRSPTPDDPDNGCSTRLSLRFESQEDIILMVNALKGQSKDFYSTVRSDGRILLVYGAYSCTRSPTIHEMHVVDAPCRPRIAAHSFYYYTELKVPSHSAIRQQMQETVDCSVSAILNDWFLTSNICAQTSRNKTHDCYRIGFKNNDNHTVKVHQLIDFAQVSPGAVAKPFKF